MNILVLCTGNSARSILLESILNHEGSGRLRAWSAGSRPTGRVHPEAIRLLQGLGHDTSTLGSKSWDAFVGPEAPRMDIVITVCGNAAAEECPLWLGSPIRTHWGVEDPAAAADMDQARAFADAYAILASRARAFLDLPWPDMDRDRLSAALARIGQT